MKFSDFVEVNPSVKLNRADEHFYIEMQDMDPARRWVHPKRKRPLQGGSRFADGDTLFARISPCTEKGNINQVAGLNGELGYGSTEFLVFREKSKVSDKDFIIYLSKWSEIKEYAANNLQGTSGRQRVAKEVFDELDIVVPDLHEQRAIASVLSSLDAKIDLLHRQNKTLEGMAEALFRQWFVEQAEEGWEESNIYELINVIYGFPFKSKHFNEDRRGLPLIRIRDLKDGFSNIYTDETCDDKYVLQCGDLVAGMDGEFRLYIWSGSKAVLNQRACKFTPAHEYVPYMYVLNLMRPHLHYYENTKVGTTVIHLGKSDIDEIRVAVPPKELLLKYGAATDPMHKKIINNHTQLRSLTALRDTLLPKLMSGEVRVGEYQHSNN